MFQITMTLGPASEDEKILSRLLKTADRFRINSSFETPESLEKKLASLKTLFEREGKTIPVVIDLQGAKMRLGTINAGLYKPESFPSHIQLIPGTSSDTPGELPVPHRELFGQCYPGDILTLNDSRVHLEVISVKPELIDTRVIQKGPLASFKGINRPKHPLKVSSLLSRDEKLIKASLPFDFVEYAYSFVYKGDEYKWLRAVTGKKITAKIELPESFAYLEQIFTNFDQVWLCRGDLGAQAGLFKLGELQKSFILFCRENNKQAHLAGQVLEHMTHFTEPTRAEAVGLYDALDAGFAGIVLSDETAAGIDPEGVAGFLDGFRTYLP